MEKTVDFDFYASSLLQTCFIVIASYLLYLTPKQVIFNVKNILTLLHPLLHYYELYFF